jgi:hypothetical protein
MSAENWSSRSPSFKKFTKGELMILIYGLLAFGAFVMLMGGLLFLDALRRDREQKWKETFSARGATP